jgi:hypothetical protein
MKGFAYGVVAALAITLSLSTFAHAGTVKTVFANSLDGGSGTRSTVTLWKGPGLNLSFIDTGESVRAIWLDDPSRIAWKTDCPRESVGECRPQVIHLNQIQPLAFKGLTKGADTLITIETERADGSRHLYPIHVLFGSGTPGYDTLMVQSDSKAVALIELSDLRRASLEDLQKGLASQEQLRIIKRSDPLYSRIQSFIVLVRNGETVANASSSAGVSMTLINHLAQIGISIAEQKTSMAVPAEPPQSDSTSLASEPFKEGSLPKLRTAASPIESKSQP